MKREEVTHWALEAMFDAIVGATRASTTIPIARQNGQSTLANYWERSEAEYRFNAGCAMAAINHLNGVSSE